ncbi:DegT/DnrJ/EryC1/StrS family aminotransferase [Hoeflea prorocentri]|uniref:DegT/DnrJ/EryC1/StrS aminotransferase family protein n=1 Tax=Hoeflea prorocentri TaxID=1922333 RepID=A0A9X3UEU9_9HYPH|nr:DegT/DnrJ/EryC1/StrS aminotransferase family protein [Hoeflea prorocentri]MCY6379343.1 DegT/DnrJ/EryC1/StrS aminotransferase family protein [Hoeflea prorocentri]MDA5397144.1 DegT/DnrJ/EryC1/StrS aminotransferase family protein [Hoeflea prorocentri]
MQFIDLAAQRARIGDRLEKAVSKVLSEGRYILGPEVSEFEEKIADYVGVKHAIACANGTDALLIPLMAWKIGPGDAVFVPSFTFAATAEVVALTGATPVFVEVSHETYNIDPVHLEETIVAIRAEGRLNPKAVLPVDLFGTPADYPAINAVCNKFGLLMLEDAAQSIGGKTPAGRCGSFGHAAATSFYPAKPLGCYGDGGAMFTNDDAMMEKLRSYAFHGKGESQYDNIHVGINSRLDTIQAAILLEKLAIFDEELEARQNVAAYYSENLKDHVRVPHTPEGMVSAWAQFAIETVDRDALKATLAERDIPSVIYYVKPLHQQPAYAHHPKGPGELTVTEQLPNSILCLPMHPYLQRSDQDRIIETIIEFASSRQAVAAE